MASTNNRFVFISCLFCCVFLSSCNTTNDQLCAYIKSVNSQQESQVSEINLKKALDVDYDSAFLFGNYTSDKDIEGVLKIPLKRGLFIPDNKHMLILLKNNIIVYEDCFFYDKVEFFFYDSTRYKYTSENVDYYMWRDSIFQVSYKKDASGDEFYQLRPYEECKNLSRI